MATLDVTEDLILGGRVRVRQPARGYRVNLDTVLLAAAVEAVDGGRYLETGCGVGGALLCAAARAPGARFLGVERDANIAALASENVALNAMADRVEIVTGDALDKYANWGVFEGVFMNPPFDREGEGRAPAEARRHAHIAEAPISVWVAALADRLTGGAALTLIHRAAKTGEILAAFEGRLGGVELIPVFPRVGASASRVLIRARKGSRAPISIGQGIVLHDSLNAKYTELVEGILRGEAAFAWP